MNLILLIILLTISWNKEKTVFNPSKSPVIYLNNPSFEEDPEEALLPSGWNRCSERSTPDILPGPFGVELEAVDGETFVGLITRADGSHEHILQRLHPRLKKKECYTTSIYLAHSKTYAGYRKPIHLRVWLGNRKCKQAQLIFESPLIKSNSWEKYNLEFTPNKNYKYLYLEAWYENGGTGRKGNILLDGIQPIRICPRA